MENRILIRDDADVPTADIAEYETSRRDLVRRGIATGGATLFASSVPLLLAARNAFAKASGDAAILTSAITLEQIAVFSYDAAIKSGALQAPVKKVATLFRDQEQAHADGLAVALKALGGTRPAKPTAVPAVDKALAGVGIKKGLAALKTQADIATFAIELESVAIGAYYDAHKKLKDPQLLMTGAQIMANEGQHITVLRGLVAAGDIKKQIPNAFENGKASA
jgi:rubrerythrin